MKIIGVIGKNGSGKDEVLKYLKDRHNVPFLSTGDMVREIAAREGRPADRATLQEISDSYERFQEQDRGEEQVFHVGEASGLADFPLSNDGNLEDLHRGVEDLIARKGLLKGN